MDLSSLLLIFFSPWYSRLFVLNSPLNNVLAVPKAAVISKVDMTSAQADRLNMTLADLLAVVMPDILNGTS